MLNTLRNSVEPICLVSESTQNTTVSNIAIIFFTLISLFKNILAEFPSHLYSTIGLDLVKLYVKQKFYKMVNLKAMFKKKSTHLLTLESNQEWNHYLNKSQLNKKLH